MLFEFLGVLESIPWIKKYLDEYEPDKIKTTP